MQNFATKPGYVEFKRQGGKPKLDDLWFMVGSRCNLSCAHCYVASSPTNDRLEQLTLGDITPFVLQACDFGVTHIYFTGGEPFINKDIMKMIEFCLQHANVTILTNATFPLTRFIPSLKELTQKSKFALTFRVSLDHFEQVKHDAIRGGGNFSLTVQNVISLFQHGFKPIITSTAVVYEDGLTPLQAQQGFKDLFKSEGIDVDVKLLPYNLEMGSNLDRIKEKTKYVFISEKCMKLPGISNEMFQCYNGRTVEKIQGEMKVYPCPIIYDTKEFELANNLHDSFKKVYLTHKACFDFCYKSKGKCTN